MNDFAIEGKILTGMSAEKLERIADKALLLAQGLRKKQPTCELALAAGIQDHSYETVRWGWVAHYSGETIITMNNGKQWKAIGHAPIGTAEYVSRDGYIEFFPLGDE